MDELAAVFRKYPIASVIFALYLIGWISPALIEVFFTSTKNESQFKNHHSPFTGFLTLSIFYLSVTLIIGFATKRHNFYLKLSGYIGISLIIFIAIYNR